MTTNHPEAGGPDDIETEMDLAHEIIDAAREFVFGGPLSGTALDTLRAALIEYDQHTVRSICADCGQNTTTIGADGEPMDWEWYMVNNVIWTMASTATDRPAQFLCIGCLETRLGRRLYPIDFTSAPVNKVDESTSPRLRSRLLNIPDDCAAAMTGDYPEAGRKR
jgi:hypothetical protein